MVSGGRPGKAARGACEPGCANVRPAFPSSTALSIIKRSLAPIPLWLWKQWCLFALVCAAGSSAPCKWGLPAGRALLREECCVWTVKTLLLPTAASGTPSPSHLDAALEGQCTLVPVSVSSPCNKAKTQPDSPSLPPCLSRVFPPLANTIRGPAQQARCGRQSSSY